MLLEAHCVRSTLKKKVYCQANTNRKRSKSTKMPSRSTFAQNSVLTTTTCSFRERHDGGRSCPGHSFLDATCSLQLWDKIRPGRNTSQALLTPCSCYSRGLKILDVMLKTKRNRRVPLPSGEN